MGFSVRIETDYGSEVLDNYPSGGKAVFAFLSGLTLYSDAQNTDSLDTDILEHVIEWYQVSETQAQTSFFPTCDALLKCLWGDGGDPTVWREDEYDFYIHRSGGNSTITREQFVEMVRSYHKSWQQISEVIAGVELLLSLFQGSSLMPLEGFYNEADTIPDFLALRSNLVLLKSRGNKTVHLNFS